MPRPEPVKIATLSSSIPIIEVSLSFLLATAGKRGYEGACDFDIAVLVNGLHFACDPRFAIGFIFVGDRTRAGDVVFEVSHLFVSFTEFAQTRWATIVARPLTHKTQRD